MIGVKFRLCMMMFLQYMVLPTWLVPLLPYVRNMTGGQDWIFAFGLLLCFGTLSSPFVCFLADRFFRAEHVLVICNVVTALALGGAIGVSSPRILLVLLLLATLAHMPTWSVTATIAMAHLSMSKFPFVRAFGTLGWIAAGGFSLIGRHYGIADFDASRWIFAAGCLSALIMAAFSLLLPKTLPQTRGRGIRIVDVLGLDAFSLFKDRQFAIFSVLITLSMIPFYWYVAYHPLYLDESGFRYLTLMQGLGQVGEIGFMLIVPILVRYLGFRWSMIVGITAIAVRYACFYVATSMGVAVGDYGGILMHGLLFGILCVGAQMYVDSVSPPALKNQAQGVLMLLTRGVGAGLSIFVFHNFYRCAQIQGGGHDWRVPFAAAIVISLILSVTTAAMFRPGGSIDQ